MIKVVSFEEIVQWLCTKQQPLWVDKLGRKEKNGIVCHFFSSYEPTSKTILITGDDGLNGKPSTIYRFDKTRWDAVMQFMGTLPYAERYISNRYGKAPIHAVNMVFRSNPPAICRAYWEEKGGCK
ncbi:MAG: hypothetical protein IJ764_02600 [Bacteroidales bacterium]|nr:hypothetical protein [Bacteroidales bacterium]